MDGFEKIKLSAPCTMRLNDGKAGMEGLDRAAIDRVIEEASQGTPYYVHQQRRQETIDARVAALEERLHSITQEERRSALTRVELVASSLEAGRDLSRSIVHVDMDAFYAAVETQHEPGLRGRPMAVGSLSMLSTSNYEARRFGVRAAMPGFIAKRLCPQLVIVPCDFAKYRRVSDKVRQVVSKYDPDYHAAGLDEMYLDVTQCVIQRYRAQLHREVCSAEIQNLSGTLEKSELSEEGLGSDDCQTCLDCCGDISFEKRDQMAFEIVEEIRTEIQKATNLTASAGIAPNLMLAKVCSDQNKPNGQFQVLSTVEAVKSFTANLAVKKVSGIGPVQGQILNALGILSCSDLWEKRESLEFLFTQATADFYIRVALGIGSNRVKSEYTRKSIGVEQTFREMHVRHELHAKCTELCNEVVEDLKSHNLLGKTIVLKIKTSTFESRTRSRTLPLPTDDVEQIEATARKLLDTELCTGKLSLRLMGIRVEKVIDKDSLSKAERTPVSIKNFLKMKESTEEDQVRNENANMDQYLSYECPVCAKDQFVQSLQDFNTHIDICLEELSTNSVADTTGDENSLGAIGNLHSSAIVETRSGPLATVSCVSNKRTVTDLQNTVSIPSGLNYHSLKSSNRTNDVDESNSLFLEEVPTNIGDNRTRFESENSFSCPVCEIEQVALDLDALNKHIDGCLNRKTIKELLAEQRNSGKRKVNQPTSETLKKLKVKERKIEDYFL